MVERSTETLIKYSVIMNNNMITRILIFRDFLDCSHSKNWNCLPFKIVRYGALWFVYFLRDLDFVPSTTQDLQG